MEPRRVEELAVAFREVAPLAVEGDADDERRRRG